MTAKEAVERSISHNEIVTIRAAHMDEVNALVSDLKAIAFDAGLKFNHTFVDDGYKTWAFKPYETGWRVHIKVEEIERDDERRRLRSMDREQYEEDLRRRQQKHLEQVYGANEAHWQPCAHDQCTNCLGTGVGRDGRPCIHSLSCPCPKCTPRYF